MRAILAVAIFLVSTSAGIANTVADEPSCSAVRLDAPGGPMAPFAVLHQGGTPFCEAYAACAVIDAARQHLVGSQAADVQCSPTALTLQVAALLQDLPANATREIKAADPSSEQLLHFADRVRGCDERVVLAGYEHTAGQCNELAFNYAVMRGDPDSFLERPGAWCNLPLTPAKLYDPNALLTKVLGTAQSDSRTLARAVKQICEGGAFEQPRLSVSRLKLWEIAKEEREARLRRFLDESLDRSEPMPVVVKYCVHALFDPTIRGAPDGILDDKLCFRNGKHGLHGSTVVGRRFNSRTKSCEYLVRNSEGPSCAEYGLECDRTAGGEPCPAGRQCGGQVWVPSELLTSNTSTAVAVTFR